jgi:tRNA uracil 4-sulfurtransferase
MKSIGWSLFYEKVWPSMAVPNAQHAIVRFGELTLKGMNRRVFVQQLRSNILQRLTGAPKAKVIVKYDHALVFLNGEPESRIIEGLSDVFGLSSFSMVYPCVPELEVVCDLAVQLLAEETPKRFKVDTRRKDKTLPFTSVDWDKAVGGAILHQSAHTVDIHNPQITVRIEVDAHTAYLSVKVYPGLGGMPVGSIGKALVLLSGGIDSPVAAYMAMKRGLSIEVVHFASPPYTSAEALRKVMDLSKVLSRFQPNLIVHTLPVTDLQLDIYAKANPAYAVILLRRAMLRLATRLAQSRHCQALITGESLGQVASQSMESLSAIQAVTELPILRPVVAFDKLEIIDVAKRIGTYPISIEPFEDCCTLFTVTNPITRPRLADVLMEESKVDYEPFLNACFDQVKSEIPVEQHNEYL